jgi:hypothetical protein
VSFSDTLATSSRVAPRLPLCVDELLVTVHEWTRPGRVVPRRVSALICSPSGLDDTTGGHDLVAIVRRSTLGDRATELACPSDGVSSPEDTPVPYDRCVTEHAAPDPPVIVQAAVDRPVFQGVGVGGRNTCCSGCTSVLENVAEGAIYDLVIECAQCGGRTPLPTRPPRRGLGGVVRRVSRNHRAVGTFILDMAEVVAGAPATFQRAQETSGILPARESLVLDIAGIEGVVRRAKSAFAPVLSKLAPRRLSRHPLGQMMAEVEANVESLRKGADVVEVFTILELDRSTQVVTRWAIDPSVDGILDESVQPEGFDHNIALLEAASVLEEAGLGPEFVATGDERSPDLALRISTSHLIQVEVKSPRALRLRSSAGATPIDARRVVKRALRSSRGPAYWTRHSRDRWRLLARRGRCLRSCSCSSPCYSACR